MDEIRDQCSQLKDGWKAVYDAIKASPATYSAHLPFSSPEQLDEVVETILYWLNRAKAPAGFAPVFHMAKGLSALSLANALTSLRSLQAGQYNHLPSFVAHLTQVLSSLHSMIVFGDKDESRLATSDLEARLSQGLALLNTAQHELGEKHQLLASAESIAQKTESNAKKVEELTEQAQETFDSVKNINEEADKKLKEIASYESEIEEAREALKILIQNVNGLQGNIDGQAKALQELNEKSKAQQQLISDLLPRGASAGLASAFGARVGELETTKKLWIGSFIVSVSGLFVTTLVLPDGNTDDIWRHLLNRLPIAGPLIWLGWFSAIQYGNTIRVQEDYAFKEATSKAFAGYKDHMDHMANINLDETRTAMTLLAEKTIQILAREPLRIFRKSERDASPTPSLLESLGIKKTEREKTET